MIKKIRLAISSFQVGKIIYFEALDHACGVIIVIILIPKCEWKREEFGFQDLLVRWKKTKEYI